jgi:hypothetical protein
MTQIRNTNRLGRHLLSGVGQRMVKPSRMAGAKAPDLIRGGSRSARRIRVYALRQRFTWKEIYLGSFLAAIGVRAGRPNRPTGADRGRSSPCARDISPISSGGRSVNPIP